MTKKRRAQEPSSFEPDARNVPAAARRLREETRRRCLALPGAVEEHPWRAAGVYKARGKIFVSTDFEGGVFEVAFKPPAEERDDALALPFVRVADYVGRFGWVQAALTRKRELEIVWPWIEAAHRRLAGRTRKT
jgi:predicted DNA-binding protein (MmcQ/YjbR family)